MPAPVAQVDASMKEGEGQKLQLYQEKMEHAKVGHV